MARKRPTKEATVMVINQIIKEITALRNDVQTLSGTLNLYIEMEDNNDKFDKFVTSKLNIEVKDDVRTDEKSSAVTVEGSP